MYKKHADGFYVRAKQNLCTPDITTKYISRYLGRPVIATSRIDTYDGENVTFHYTRHEDNKNKQPTELTKEMACELIDKIVVHEAVGKKPNRQQQVDIYYNFIGQFDLPLSEKEIAEARRKAEREAAEKAKCKKNRQRESNAVHRAKTKAERWAANDGHKYPKRICEQCGKEFYPKAQSRFVCRAADYRQAERLPCRPQRAGRSIVFSAGKAAFRKRGRYGSPQSGKSNAVGAEDEQHPQCCYGNRFKQTYLLLGVWL